MDRTEPIVSNEPYHIYTGEHLQPGHLLPRDYVGFVRQGVADIDAIRKLLAAPSRDM